MRRTAAALLAAALVQLAATTGLAHGQPGALLPTAAGESAAAVGVRSLALAATGSASGKTPEKQVPHWRAAAATHAVDAGQVRHGPSAMLQRAAPAATVDRQAARRQPWRPGSVLLQLRQRHRRGYPEEDDPKMLWGLPKMIWVIMADVMAMIVFL